jgi:hypothetical protein
VVTGGKFPLTEGVVFSSNHRSARMTSSTASLHSLPAPAALPHQVRHTITSRNPFLPDFRRDAQERSAGATDASSGQSFDHHARHFILRHGKSFTGISFHGREALIHSPISVGRTSVKGGKLLPVWCIHHQYTIRCVPFFMTHWETRDTLKTHIFLHTVHPFLAPVSWRSLHRSGSLSEVLVDLQQVFGPA